MMKYCSKCNSWLNKSNFVKRKASKDGLNYYCNECKRKIDKKYRENNKEKIREIKKIWYQKNKEHFQDPEIKKRLYKATKKWIKKNEEHRKKYVKEWRNDNKEHLRQYGRKRLINNKEYFRIHNKKYRENNKEKIREYFKSEKGQIAVKKRNAKRKEKGFIPLWDNPFCSDIKINHHHLNDKPGIVVPMPEKTHLYVSGQNHKNHNADWIEKLYSINVDDFLGDKL